MDFARLWEQARELWARPIGKVVLGAVAVFIIGLAAASVLVTRPQYVTLATFGQQDAPKVAQKLDEKKITYRQEGNGFTFAVPQAQLNTARLVLAETELDPATAQWSPDLWKNRVSWSNTEFDKRVNRIEQIEANLRRSIETLSVVDRAFVQISVPLEKPLFVEQEKPPKANVVIYPSKGEKLSRDVVKGIMELVGVVEGLDPKTVVVMDASTSRVVSGDAWVTPVSGTAQNEQRVTLEQMEAQIQDRYQTQLTQQLERVVGAGNVSVMVNLTFNWEQVQTEAVAYQGANSGKGVVVSEQRETSASEGQPKPATTTPPVGTTTNSEPQSPTYPGSQASAATNVSSDASKQIINYLVNQINTKSDKPGGGVEEISVGVLVNQARVNTDAMKNAITSAVKTAMGSKANVDVQAVPFADDLLKLFEPRPAPVAGIPDWLYWVAGAALGLLAVGFFFIATRPRHPVLQPVFAGPEAALMGGIPVTEVELPPPAAAGEQPEDIGEQRLPETAEELAKLSPEEAAKLSDDVLTKLGADPENVRLLEQIDKIAKNQPGQIANLLRTWMAEE